MNDATTLDRPVQPTLQVRQIVAGQNYREHYDAKALADLREQVKAAGGIKSPIMVRPHPTRDGVWEIVYGHRRWMVAGEQYGDTYDMPVTIEDLSDAEARALGIIENKGRDNPSAIEEAKGAADLLRFNAGDKEKTANQLGWKLRELDNRLLLLNCAPEVQKAWEKRYSRRCSTAATELCCSHDDGSLLRQPARHSRARRHRHGRWCAPADPCAAHRRIGLSGRARRSDG